ncbi:MAG: amidase [Haliea sp.]|uniref:amidase n=1 Tax=Haliea sp. TaxID=1932666 RepID=UPI0032ED01B1
MDEIAFSDATNLVERLRAKELSSSELLDHYVARMDRYNPEINAIIATQLDKARARAKEADKALAKGHSWGPLHGLPMTVKESYNISDMATTWGDPLLRDNIATSDAVACQRLQAAGAVIFGKTNVPLSLGDFQSYNEVYGTTNNPYDLSRVPGGSSGGSAAALASGMTGLEMGSDIGGSIRNPAHYCGVYGHKPTWGILPMRGHALPGILAPTDISVIGPLARSARDLATVLTIVGGADELHAPGWSLELPAAKQKRLGDWRVAVWADDDLAPVDKAISDRVLQVAKLVEDAGGSVHYTARPKFSADHSHEQYEHLLYAAIYARQPREVFEKNLKRLPRLDPEDKSELAYETRGSTLYYRDWHAFNERRTHLRWAWHEFFRGFDILLTPVSATTAFPHDQSPQLEARQLTVNNAERPYFEQIFWAGLSGVAYLPSTVLPTGLDDRGLPIGVQVVAREMGDLVTIEFARQVSEALGGFSAPAAYRD